MHGSRERPAPRAAYPETGKGLHQNYQWDPRKTQNVSPRYIRDDERSLLRGPELILGRWVRFFSDLLNGESDQLDHSTIAEIPQHSIAHVLGVEPTEEVVASALPSMANAKAVGPDDLLVKLLNLGLHHDATVLREFHRVITRVWRER